MLKCKGIFILLVFWPHFASAYEEYAPTYKKARVEFLLEKPFGPVTVSAEIDGSSNLLGVNVQHHSDTIRFAPDKEEAQFPKADINNMRILVGHDVGKWLMSESSSKAGAPPDPPVSHILICIPYGEYYEVKDGWARSVVEVVVRPKGYSVAVSSLGDQRNKSIKEGNSCPVEKR